MKILFKKNKYRLISLLSLLVVIFIWIFVTDISHAVSPLILPSPIKVIQTFVYKLQGGTIPDGASLLNHIASSLKVALGGFLAGVIIGVPLGIGMAWNQKFERIAKPLFDLIRPIPALAWIPLMILWLGIGYASKVGIVFFASVISATVNSYTGIRRTSEVHLWVAQTFGATRNQMLFKIAIPTAMPLIFTGLRLALGSSWVALVAAELVAATSGLGYMIQMGRMLGRPDIIIVGMLTIGVIGLLMSKVLEFLQKKFVKGGRLEDEK
ncbi:ABC transporter permease [Vagococcus elongatus]|uniref:Alanine dehydrogenase n=1 Tax=Vagococcus elongatus TaxID=180344 RepID=A0A430AHV1_9ENTE|nr:ABC transporter permease [Vagococcus elongatus]RSU07651.1 alanine dehydrogenase [Vagococcus elongatus]